VAMIVLMTSICAWILYLSIAVWHYYLLKNCLLVKEGIQYVRTRARRR